MLVLKVKVRRVSARILHRSLPHQPVARNCVTGALRRMLPLRAISSSGLEFRALSARDKTHDLTPRANKSGYERTQTKLLARTVARQYHLIEVHEDMGNK